MNLPPNNTPLYLRYQPLLAAVRTIWKLILACCCQTLVLSEYWRMSAPAIRGEWFKSGCQTIAHILWDDFFVQATVVRCANTRLETSM